MIRTVAVRSRADALDALFKRAIKDEPAPDYLAGPLGHYFCIAVAGFLENAHADIFAKFAERKASPNIARYAFATLRQVKNPKSERFVQTAKRFDDLWGSRLEAFVGEESGRRKGAIDSIMSNRNLIAHGRSSSITIRQCHGYFKSALEVLVFIEKDIFQD